MEKFPISPEDCLVVRALGRTRTLREAAGVLGCDAASLVRRAQRISVSHGLIEKVRGRWRLTDSGRRAALWVEQSISAQKLALNERPRRTIATTMWIAEQVLIPELDILRSETQDQFVWSINTVSSDFENDLLNGLSDYVVACSPPKDPLIAHSRIVAEDWVVIAPPSWRGVTLGTSPDRLRDYLRAKPCVRHSSVNPEAAVGIEMNEGSTFLLVDSLISVRSAVEAGHGWSCVPAILIRNALKARRVVRVNLPVQAKGYLCVWWLRGRNEAAKGSSAVKAWLSKVCSSL